ncbi:hypothetical protein QR680_006211 [Steinernema hermaphroditum]|uniref:Inosine/uridine-preferring nucleoside hydrolase domain-containing protein n=1 Tax=Steinernema hermaphroditum TaxID=289476 RepID=A0AA39HW27_9BILA|nr:hypothetical protein QR680_006211 [Steinernema hermaphroditum]
MRVRTKLIVDTDGVTDDIRALCIASQNAGAELVAVSTVHGCVSVEQATANVSRTLRANGKKIPIYKGAANPIIAKPLMDMSEIFGKDGMGDKPEAFPAVIPEDFTSFVPNKHAAQALIDLCREDNEIILVCLGPLTNVALALKLDPSFAKLPKKLVIMGGNYYGIGNVASHPTVEFNFYGDPEAAHIALAEMECPILSAPWEAFLLEGKKHEAEVDFEAHLHFDTKLSRFLKEATSVIRPHMTKKHRQYAYCDEIALAAAIDPENVIRQSRMLRVTVELAGHLTRGQVVVDWTHPSCDGQLNDVDDGMDMSKRAVQFITSYDVKVVDEMMIDAVKKL